MNQEARDKAAKLAEGLTNPRHVVAYNEKANRVAIFKFGPNRKEASLVGWRVIHRFTPKVIKAAVQAAPVEQPAAPIPAKESKPATTAPKRGRPFTKSGKA